MIGYQSIKISIRASSKKDRSHVFLRREAVLNGFTVVDNPGSDVISRVPVIVSHAE